MRSAKQKTSTCTKENAKSITNKKTKNIVLKEGDASNSHINGKIPFGTGFCHNRIND